ncbi:N-methylhydantoinase A/acetone carboxylase, beta subunit [Desulfitobacterium dichloroeliminans LMG P-21439]|uniref:N-methylhydantoinase A/acetone carboxylase, beta subunit n=1 Tax=Desulfitobacterium dichloroeliminans (strain LMG P-21439 / DCA1) TaxID=871963 RepID=L0F648_DESDL|nr:hydantoinase/oxoprolinase family protein [Desulfitobacterium dichloroeliminans]AGA69314.1 N-methylhydantoinase A/acetone carboxylase, beta subunit [Desulfitobacterium dichloroeliminans LMG P-21439]
MAYQVGIDVGGTFTDGVLIHENRLINKTKVPTQSDNLLDTLLQALDELGVFTQPVEQITVSTTLVTNAILENKLPPVELFLFPGSGMKLDALPWPVPYHSLKGEIDYRGREVTLPDELEWRRICHQLDLDSESQAAVVSKFSHRNKILEESLAQFLSKRYPELDIALGYEWGHANFYRRSLTTYLNTASKNLYANFSAQLHKAVAKNGSKAEITVLKADGGILPSSQLRPVESINSGPAASIIGALAQSDPQQSYAVVDIGGTTTDIGLVLSGEPLLSAHGAQIGPYLTLIRSLATRSIPIGGDSAILSSADVPEGFIIAPYRQGPAYCLDGNCPTPTDAMRYLKRINFGHWERAAQGLATLLPPEARNPQSLHDLALRILDKFAAMVTDTFTSLYKEWREEPAYKVWEVLHPHSSKDFYIWVSGGSAQGIAPSLEDKVHLPVRFSEHADVSNAIGSALARPTFSCTLHLDTTMRSYRIEEYGEQGEWFGAKRPHKEVQEFLMRIARDKALSIGLNLNELELKTQTFDFFPVVKGYETVGQIIRGSVVVPPGVVGRLMV